MDLQSMCLNVMDRSSLTRIRESTATQGQTTAIGVDWTTNGGGDGHALAFGMSEMLMCDGESLNGAGLSAGDLRVYWSRSKIAQQVVGSQT